MAENSTSKPEDSAVDNSTPKTEDIAVENSTSKPVDSAAENSTPKPEVENSTPGPKDSATERRPSVRPSSPPLENGNARQDVQKAQLQSVPVTNMVTNNVNRTALHPSGVK